MINTQWMFIYQKPFYFKSTQAGISWIRHRISCFFISCTNLINKKVVCMCTVRALKRKCARVACHRQKTAGGCIDFRWSTNIQLVVMRYQQYLSLHSGCYFRQHFSGRFCAIIILPVNMTKKANQKSELACFKKLPQVICFPLILCYFEDFVFGLR